MGVPANYNGTRFNLNYAVKGVVHYVNKDKTKAKTYFGGIRVNYENGSAKDTLQYEFEIPCHSLYVCPFTNNALKATYVLNKKNPDHYILNQTILGESVESGDFIGIETYDNFYLITDQKCETMAYVYKPKSGYRYEVRNMESDKIEDFLLFRSKSELVRYVFGAVEKYGTVSGLQFCNLNIIPDDVLENLGCLKISDVMNNGQPLWMACIDNLVNPERLTGTWMADVKEKLFRNAFNLINSFREYIENNSTSA